MGLRWAVRLGRLGLRWVVRLGRFGSVCVVRLGRFGSVCVVLPLSITAVFLLHLFVALCGDGTAFAGGAGGVFFVCLFFVFF